MFFQAIGGLGALKDRISYYCVGKIEPNFKAELEELIKKLDLTNYVSLIDGKRHENGH